jgi:hypothetical protein
MKAHDRSAGSNAFRGQLDTRKPPQRPAEKENERSKRSGALLR